MAREERVKKDSSKDIESDGLQDRVVHIARVAKVVKGGRRFSFSALVVVGDGKGRVGFGLGKAGEVPDAIKKGADQAKKNMLKIITQDGTIPFETIGKFGSAKVLMFPARKGTGTIAGGSVRIICELAGIQDIVCKVHGTKNYHSVVRAAINGLKEMVSVEDYAADRGKSLDQILQLRNTKSKGSAK
ncbi:MAG: 30S ribosomal protein S5 [Proteobacteria bacterium]|nr:30S ribosomal protein S5 [Pseudomonadota bacterium]